MSLKKLILSLGFLLIISWNQSPAADQDLTGNGNFYSSYRHYTLLKTAAENGPMEIAGFGGEIPNLPYVGARLYWDYSHLNLYFHEYGPTDTDFRLVSRNEKGRLGLELPVLNDKVSLKLTSGISGHGPRPRLIYDNRIGIHPIDFASFEFLFSRLGEDLDLDGTILGEQILISFRTDRTAGGFSGRVQIWSDISVHSGFTDYQFEDTNFTGVEHYESGLYGAATYHYHGLTAGRLGGYFLKVEYGKLSGRGRLDFNADGTRFGQIAGLQVNGHRWHIEAGLPGARPFRLSLERYSGRAEMNGHIESWPFTEPLIDLLGVRRNFRAEAEAVVWHASTGKSFEVFYDLEIIAKLDLFRVYPKLHWADWMPVYMVFGVTDMDHYYDEYDRIDFGSLNLNLSRSIGRLVLNCQVTQLFPIRLKKTAAADDQTADPGDAGTDEAKDDHPRDDGGRTITFRLAYRF